MTERSLRTTPGNRAKQASRRPLPPEHSRWKPGQSGNAAGVSKSVAEVRRIMQGHSAECVELLMEAARAGNIEAAKFIVDHACGRARPSIESAAELDDSLDEFSSSVLIARLRELTALEKESTPTICALQAGAKAERTTF